MDIVREEKKIRHVNLRDTIKHIIKNFFVVKTLGVVSFLLISKLKDYFLLFMGRRRVTILNIFMSVTGYTINCRGTIK